MKGNGTLYMHGCGSTLQKANRKNYQSIAINVDTMLNLCRKYVPKNEIIQFCKIDVEGGEKNVLLGYDFENYRPKVFCIESTLPNTEKLLSHLSFIINFLCFSVLKKGYIDFLYISEAFIK